MKELTSKIQHLMQNKQSRPILTVILGGVSLLTLGAALAYWQTDQQKWCLRFTSAGDQEVTYSRGCYNPRRYKQWVITAAASDHHLASRYGLKAPTRGA
jgi:hypothetical protein